MTRTISNSDDVIDSRDIVARIEELEQEIANAEEEFFEEQKSEKIVELQKQIADFGNPEYHENEIRKIENQIEDLEVEEFDFDATKPWIGIGTAEYPEHGDPVDSDLRHELKVLKELEEEGFQAAGREWKHGATLIRESYFEDFIKQDLEDIGELPKNLPSYIAIDWSATADNLKADYSEVDYDGETYLIRNS